MNVKFCRLENPEHKLPMPDRGGRYFSEDGEWVDVENPFYRQCIKEGCMKIDDAAGEKRTSELAAQDPIEAKENAAASKPAKAKRGEK